jgi:hypothetical protein
LRILAVTSRAALEGNVGIVEARAVLEGIEALGAVVHDVPGAADLATAVDSTRSELAAGSYRGVLIVGGPDVIPLAIVDALPAELRRGLGDNDDLDDFVVWSDEPYGDTDGDGIAELPVSRLPDGRSAPFLTKVAAAMPGTRQRSAAIRNLARPFAERVYQRLPGRLPMLVSQPTQPRDARYPISADLLYLMLHGDWEEADVFKGEMPGPRLISAIDVRDVGTMTGAVVFAGCCWGALTVDATARDVAEGRHWAPRTPERSMALTYLAQGAHAFVGCTGVHYSPIDPPLFHYGEPMHQYFFEELQTSPAEAIFKARVRYLPGIPHGPRDLRSQAIEYKIWREFTCLGLGW